MRLVVCDNGLLHRSGHHANLAAGLLDEGARRGLEVAVLANVAIEPEVAAELGAVPVFRTSPYNVANFGPCQQTLSWRRCGRVLADDLRSVAVRPDDVLLFPTARAAEVLGVARWLGSARAAVRAVCVNFMFDDLGRRHPWFRRLPWLAMYRISFALLRRRSGSCQVLLTSGSPPLAAALGRLARSGVRAYPLPKTYPAAVVPVALPDPPAVLFVGVPWAWKGGHFLAEIARRCSDSGRKFRLLVQEPPAHNSEVMSTFAAVRSLPGIEIASGALDREAYFELMRRADIVLLPYDPRRYRRMTSGVFAEALALGKPVVAPSETWMADTLARGDGAGVLFGRFEADTIARALGQALDDLEALALRAQRTARAWRETQCLGAFLDRLLSDLAAEGP